MNLVSPSHPALWTVAQPVVEFAAVPEISGMMINLAIKHRGIGLAATQCGLSRRLFVMLLSSGATLGWITCVNPSIVWRSRHTVSGPEGCLSFPGQFINVKRHKAIDLTYRDERGRDMRRHLTGMDAIVASHELDHLDGICILPKPATPAGAAQSV